MRVTIEAKLFINGREVAEAWYNSNDIEFRRATVKAVIEELAQKVDATPNSVLNGER